MVKARIPALFTFALGIVVCASMFALADDNSPSTAPASQPATAPYIPHIAQVPKGFHDIMVGDRRIFCDPADDAWVKQGVANAKPATRPSTMPSDILQAAQAGRTELTHTIMTDLAMTDPKPIDEMYDQSDGGIIPVLTKLNALKPPVIFMPVSETKLIALIKAGWSDPRFHYNQYSEEIEYSDEVGLAIDHAMDDSVMWIAIKDDDTPEQRAATLSKGVEDFDGSFGESLSLLVQSGIRNVFSDFIYNKIMMPLNFPSSVSWYPRGVACIFGAKYTTMITGNSRARLDEALAADDVRNPLSGSGLDLLHPIDPANIRPDLIPYYKDAMLHKSSAIVDAWVTQGGDGVVAKTLPAIKANMPATPDQMLKIIKDATGIDLTPELLPNYHVPPPSTQP